MPEHRLQRTRKAYDNRVTSNGVVVALVLWVLCMIVLALTVPGCTVDQCHSSLLSSPSNVETCVTTRIP
jgi:hypothetical protein